jgi:hypothetical protein
LKLRIYKLQFELRALLCVARVEGRVQLYTIVDSCPATILSIDAYGTTANTLCHKPHDKAMILHLTSGMLVITLFYYLPLYDDTNKLTESAFSKIYM